MPKVKISASEAPVEVEDVDFGEVDDRNDDGGYMSGLDESDESEDEDEFKIEEEDTEPPPLKMQILPLYSLLPTREQLGSSSLRQRERVRSSSRLTLPRRV